MAMLENFNEDKRKNSMTQFSDFHTRWSIENFELAKQLYDRWRVKINSNENTAFSKGDLFEKYLSIVNHAQKTINFWKKVSNDQLQNTTIDKDFFISNFSETISNHIFFENIKSQFLRSEFVTTEGEQIFLSSGKNGKLSFFIYDRDMWTEYIAMFLKLFYLGGFEYDSNIKIAFVGTIDSRHTLYRIGSNFPKSQVGIFGLQESFKEYSKKLLRFNPDIIIGYSSAVTIAVQKLSDKIKPKLVITNTDYLSDNSRKYIIEQWNSKVINTFTMTEAGILAFECPHGRMHLNEEHILVKKINDKLTLTNVVNKVQPFIHYIIPDSIKIIKNDSCPCSLSSQIIEIEKGRQYKTFKVLINGKTLSIHPITIRSALDGIEGIVDYDYGVKEGRLFIDFKIDKKYTADEIKMSIEKEFLKFNLKKEFINQIVFINV